MVFLRVLVKTRLRRAKLEFCTYMKSNTTLIFMAVKLKRCLQQILHQSYGAIALRDTDVFFKKRGDGFTYACVQNARLKPENLQILIVS